MRNNTSIARIIGLGLLLIGQGLLGAKPQNSREVAPRYSLEDYKEASDERLAKCLGLTAAAGTLVVATRWAPSFVTHLFLLPGSLVITHGAFTNLQYYLAIKQNQKSVFEKQKLKKS